MQPQITVRSSVSGSRNSTQRACFLPCKQSRRSIAHSDRRALRVAAQQQQQEQKPAVAKFADSVGLPTEEGLFGFKPFPEVWVGRLAMMGFVTSIVEEAITKKGTLGQIGFITPSPPLFITISGAATVATFVALAVTFYNANTGKMTARDAQRYRGFLGINKESQNIADSQKTMKGQGDPVSRVIGPDNLTDIAQARKDIPADKLLNFDDRAEAESSASQSKMDGIQDSLQKDNQQKQGMPGPNMSLAYRDDEVERQNFANEPTLKYARQVEITNGRWAMLGFLAAITIEAATGKGILSQCIFYAKASGLLGQQSGF
ncbi:TPA: hypothetical protein ACH3X1_006772 [Trebouxia sp. C0004]